MGVSVQLVALVSLAALAFYVLLLMAARLMPKKKHKYTGGVDELGRYDGVGKLIAVNGDVYTGDFRAGTFHGNGTYVFKKGGGSYTGEFREGLFAGQGREVYPDGSVYVGGFDNSKRSGHGVMHYANGAVFTGAWKTGKKDGRGLFRYADGTRFDGRFVDGRREGTGFIYDAKNRKLQGKWRNGKLMNKGKLTRVLHKEKAEGSGEDEGSGGEQQQLLLGAGSSHGGGGAAAMDELDEGEAKDHLDSTPKLRHRSTLGAAGSSSSSSHTAPTALSSSHSSHHSPHTSTPKRLSSAKEKELTNQLLNFSKKQATNFNSMARSTEARMARERDQLINQLAASSRSMEVSRAGGAASTTLTTSSSSSSASSTSHSSASTTTQSPTLQGKASRRDSALGPLLGGDSSGVESELASASHAEDDDGGDHPAGHLVVSPSGRASSAAHGEWGADSPTHVSNSHSHAATPLLGHSAAQVSPRSNGGSATVKTPSSRQYASSGSEKEPDSRFSSPRLTASRTLTPAERDTRIHGAAAAAVAPEPAGVMHTPPHRSSSDASPLDEERLLAAHAQRPNSSPAQQPTLVQ